MPARAVLDPPVAATQLRDVLVVDDDPMTSKLIAHILRETCTVRSAADGHEGLRLVQHRRPELILCDLMMPGMSGQEFFTAVKSRPEWRAVPLIFLTARSTPEDRADGLEFGADDYIVKPFYARELRARVHSLLKLREYQLAVADRNRTIEEELDIARRIMQERILPHTLPALPTLRMHSIYRPMDKIGGDFYDVVDFGDRRGLIVADVSGHGIPGAFIAALTQMAFRLCTRQAEEPHQVLQLMNEELLQRCLEEFFVTAVYLEYDPRQRTIRYCNAGHQCRPVLYRNGALEVWDGASSYPLAIIPELEATTAVARVRAGDRLFLYTDGIIECDDGDETFGEERLHAFLRVHAHLPAADLEALLLEELLAFSKQPTFADDVTMLIFDFLESPQPSRTSE